MPCPVVNSPCPAPPDSRMVAARRPARSLQTGLRMANPSPVTAPSTGRKAAWLTAAPPRCQRSPEDSAAARWGFVKAAHPASGFPQRRAALRGSYRCV